MHNQNPEQIARDHIDRQWLRMIKEFIAMSFHIEKEDFDLDPFNKNGGLQRFYNVFGDNYQEIIEELNEVLSA
ncbi:MAG: type I restriction-modification enzyme R subunit C-terminal domain-containing protein [bacterium]